MPPPLHPAAPATVLVVDDDEMVVALVEHGLRKAGIEVTTAEDGATALERLAESLPDVVVSDVNMPQVDGFELARRMRADPQLRTVPIVFLTSRGTTTDVLTGLQLGGDDYVSKPFEVAELVARVQAKVARRPVPVDLLPQDPRTGVHSGARLRELADREVRRAGRTGRDGYLAAVELDELALIRQRLGGRAADAVARQVVDLLTSQSGPLDEVGRDGDRFLLLMPETSRDDALRRCDELSQRVVGGRFAFGAERLRATPVVGLASLIEAGNAEAAIDRAVVAAYAAGLHLDLRPVVWTTALAPKPESRRKQKERPWRERLRTPLQILATLVLGLVIPFFVYLGLANAGFDISGVAYLIVVVALLVTGTSMWIEGFLALDAKRPPDEPGTPYPAASAIIAAYLPNEAATVMETIDAFLAVDYDAPLQVILAYNTPKDMPIEREFVEIAQRDPRFVPLRVTDSTSKAQNVNAALAYITGEFVGVFDADHMPEPQSFKRAWRWLSNGYDVVQGHAVVRNGDASLVGRTVAVEFESIYGVSHPGRTRLHDFGIFGGSNGYWRSELLRATRMRGSMLTEDIDSSMRVTEQGYRIASDPALVSRELAPTEWKQLWNQRMRWAQGWFQVSLRHVRPVITSRHLSLRQKLGALFLLGWREVYPWISLQMFPIVAYKAYAAGGAAKLNWLLPLFVLTSLFTLSVGPGQVLFAYLVAHPTVKQHRKWFVGYFFVASIFYTEYKNVIARVAQIKEVMGERAWKVTPRQSPTTATAIAGNATPQEQEQAA